MEPFAKDAKVSLARRVGARWDRLSDAQKLGAQAGGLGAVVVGGEIGGRQIGQQRYKQGRHVNDGFFMGPAVNRGYYKARRKAEGPKASMDDGNDRVVRKAAGLRDENSSISTKISWEMPKGKGLRPTLHARSGYAAGTTRGVGRKATGDENSSPAVEWLQPRRPDGKFASKEAGVKVFHPKYGTGHRMPRQSTLMRYTKEGDKAAKTFVGKSLGDARAVLEFGAHGQVYGSGARRGVNIAKAANAARYGGVLERMAAQHPRGSKAHTQLSVMGASGGQGGVTASHSGDGIRSTLKNVKQGRNADYAARRLERSRVGRYGRANPATSAQSMSSVWAPTQRARQLP